jgi:hypothetical protein
MELMKCRIVNSLNQYQEEAEQKREAERLKAQKKVTKRLSKHVQEPVSIEGMAD